MEVGNGFPAVGAVIDHDAVAGFREPFLTGHPGGGGEECPEQRGVGGCGLGETRNRALRHHEEMNRRLGADVVEGDPVLPLAKDAGGDFPRGDLLKEGHSAGKRVR